MKCLIIDNYDSFTYNLYQQVATIFSYTANSDHHVEVIRNDERSCAEIKKASYDRIIISPGPGNPKDAAYFGVCSDVIKTLGANTPILGICLGMQGIASCFGGEVVPAQTPIHGRTSIITHDNYGVFTELPQLIEVMRYHSLIVDQATLPAELTVTATAQDTGEIMGIRHRVHPIEGVQFHPESFASEGGNKLLMNFIHRSYQ